MENSKIQWTTHTFNPWVGCDKVSPGCANCYAEAQDTRWGKGRWGKGAPRERTSVAYWQQPAKWQKAAEKAPEAGRPRVFCASMADWLDVEVDRTGPADIVQSIRQRLTARKGDDMAEWPEGLRVRQFPRPRGTQ